MAQVLEFKLPDLGEGLTEAEIVRWLVDVGDVVAIDQPVVEVETAKAMVEVPCPYGGVVTARFGEEGTELPVGSPLLTVAVGSAEDTAGPGASGPAPGPARTSDPDADADTDGDGGSAGETSGNVLVGYGTGAPAARRRRVRPTAFAASASSPAPARGPAPEGASHVAAAAASASAPVSARVRDTEDQGPVAVVSPLVRRLARQHGLDLRHIAGSGRDGLILRTDVESAIRNTEQESSSAASLDARPAPDAVGPVAGERIALRGVRGAVADKLSRSRHEIPDATCWVDADATELMAARAAMNGTRATGTTPKISVLALLARICTAALARFPELNSTVDTEAREIVRLPGVHLGFAAQTERGLVVPVVRDAHTRNAESISAEIGTLTEAARAGRLTPAQLTGGTFTLNNYGVFGVDGSTPIINHPEAAMLGVGRIVAKPWVHEGELAVRQVVQLSLTFDHRVCDGGTAGGFLRYVADCVEQPALLLRTL
ncbi:MULTISPECIES: dihydrolipoamide acetyltransferase family protein [unclassified Streptomyces]|uniref:dihydrolipoamide acetyltransferase family protein n=1 Tax=unclassified Streptomyces TaxID=2593676 RepID=UPI0001C19DC5|nr:MULTISPECIES: dihydrolipoamide acetyltransferase family protein [unclassified Streptomyces]AEN11122.1 catalytic domain of components of various dehydrogenase complexes [Streptomyces sp. SirexAA-E]MYR65851.1 2-oxo acid dehydrogenase subunit E2 [Streptomyces sp. SID4939]MYS02215.1 2-oxo acid dehydrogenase subunit E2 [Streptomyces sp. SID4940]MYT63613.1 2-oxo acid dehydrogenase subunit E2 [Streptomyces sp. SID8357]MYT85863.1 2-oxo acid dehydrogenase subunit E2 [Streptomyces sp. SID8360]